MTIHPQTKQNQKQTNKNTNPPQTITLFGEDVFPFKGLLGCKLNPKSLSRSPQSYHSEYISPQTVTTLVISYIRANTEHVPAQPGTHTPRLSTLNGLGFQLNLRCGLESFQEIGVTTLRVLAPCWLPPMLQQQNTRKEENTLLPKIHSPCLGYGTEKS